MSRTRRELHVNLHILWGQIETMLISRHGPSGLVRGKLKKSIFFPIVDPIGEIRGALSPKKW